MQSGKYRSPGNHQTQTRPLDSSLQRTCLHCSRVQWRSALHHCIQRFAVHLLSCCCSQLLPPCYNTTNS
ncbi:unnamed protein product [Staurois parvus]|uniref:Uncharacterized protein n=1 Tax=Staurois parvus TaxID=386267 RepID=A0ABN9D6Q1_9NEOB|nr:unnamed protein product [Staurois parvus]